jgi:hypothetical protein
MPTMTTPKEQIKEWRALSDQALLNGEWGWQRPFLAQYATAVSVLLSERDALLSLLREVEWSGPPLTVQPLRTCPACRGVHPDEFDANAGWVSGRERRGHAPDCRLAAFLGSGR